MRILLCTTIGLAFAATVMTQGPAAAATCVLIKNVTQLQRIQNDLTGNYCLANDIDASTKANFRPIATSGFFSGTLDGRGFTISNLTVRTTGDRGGLFGQLNNATIKNLTLENVDILVGTDQLAAAGALAGTAFADPASTTAIANVHVSGHVLCRGGSSCDAGGLIGSTANLLVRDSSSAVEVRGPRFIGGLIGLASHGTVTRSYSTGAVSCSLTNCMAAGLIGRIGSTAVTLSFATGPVTATGGSDGRAGGLIGLVEGTPPASVTKSFALGTVDGGAGAMAGGLVAQFNGGSGDQLYSVGRVGGTGSLGGLIANAAVATITNAYWDIETSGRTTSVVGTGLTTSQLRAARPAGFDASWRITAGLSYPYLAVLSFAAPLATLVEAGNVFIMLPISQLDLSQYATTPAHDDADQASLATVYTMIARAVGLTEGVGRLEDVPIDRYFWDDADQRAQFTGPIRTLVTRGTFVAIPDATPLDSSNVIGAMSAGRLVILRGRFHRAGGARGTHWMLATLFTGQSGNPTGVVAHDPWTGLQVTIDPATKAVVDPARFPLARFVVDGYQPVTIN